MRFSKSGGESSGRRYLRRSSSPIRDVHESGFCAASWQPEVVALATPLQAANSFYSLNVSVSSGESLGRLGFRDGADQRSLFSTRSTITPDWPR